MQRFNSFLFIVLVAFLFSACLKSTTNSNSEIAQQPAEEGNYAPQPFEVPNPQINLANPLEVSKNPDDVALCNSVKEIIAKSSYANARWGIMAASLRDGRVICEIDGRKLFNPASIQKVLTSIVALETLGADFRWKTSIYGKSEINNGVLEGNLYLYGTGAPDFDSKKLEDLVNQLQAKGLRQVSGDIIGDESWFRGDNIGDGWTWNELQWYYGAEASALTFNGNEAFVGIEKGSPKASTEFIQVSIGQPAASNSTEKGGIKRGLSDNEFVIWGGEGKDFGGRVAVSNPALIAAKTLKSMLEKRGITISGSAKFADWKSAEKLDTTNSPELAVVMSETLAEAVKRMNKRSDNLYAELVLRAIGRKVYDIAPRDEDRAGEVRGTDAAATAYIKKWLRERHVAADELQIHDGSGLSRLDFVTPESFVRALIYAAQSPTGQVFADSLPVAATDGTLGGRLGKIKGKVIAKTGSITYVNSLTGYASTTNGETLAFAIICNNATKKNDANRVIDEIAITLAGEKSETENSNKNSTLTNSNKNANTNTNANEIFNMNRIAGQKR